MKHNVIIWKANDDLKDKIYALEDKLYAQSFYEVHPRAKHLVWTRIKHNIPNHIHECVKEQIDNN